MATLTSNSVAPSAQVVGNAFVEQYYLILQQSPELLYRFYKDSSVISRPEPNGTVTSVSTMKAINAKILSLDYREFKTEIKTVDAQESYKDGVTILVTGWLTGKHNVRRKFTQSFFLAPQDKGYFVLNDIFRYADENETLASSSMSANGVCDSTHVAPFTPDPGQCRWDVEKVLLKQVPDRASGSTFNFSEQEQEEILQAARYDSRGKESSLPQKVLDSLCNIPKSAQHDPNSVDRKNVVKKRDSLGKGFDFHSAGTKLQLKDYAEGAEYQVFQKEPSQHWDSMKSCFQKAATAYSRGERSYAAFLSEQGRVHKKMAQEADEKASWEIFEASNKNLENVVTIDLHGQHVKQAIKLLKVHLFLFTKCIPSILFLRVITGYGKHSVGRGKLKQAVIGLIEKEGIKWSEENRGTLLVRLDWQKEWSFIMDSDSD